MLTRKVMKQKSAATANLDMRSHVGRVSPSPKKDRRIKLDVPKGRERRIDDTER